MKKSINPKKMIGRFGLILVAVTFVLIGSTAHAGGGASKPLAAGSPIDVVVPTAPVIAGDGRMAGPNVAGIPVIFLEGERARNDIYWAEEYQKIARTRNGSDLRDALERKLGRPLTDRAFVLVSRQADAAHAMLKAEAKAKKDALAHDKKAKAAKREAEVTKKKTGHKVR